MCIYACVCVCGLGQYCDTHTHREKSPPTHLEAVVLIFTEVFMLRYVIGQCLQDTKIKIKINNNINNNLEIYYTHRSILSHTHCTLHTAHTHHTVIIPAVLLSKLNRQGRVRHWRGCILLLRGAAGELGVRPHRVPWLSLHTPLTRWARQICRQQVVEQKK